MSLDLSTLNVGDELDYVDSGSGEAVDTLGAVVLMIGRADGLGVDWAVVQRPPDFTPITLSSSATSDEDGDRSPKRWRRKPPPPPIDPEKVWYQLNHSGDLTECIGHRDGTCRSTTDVHFRITATEPVE